MTFLTFAFIIINLFISLRVGYVDSFRLRSFLRNSHCPISSTSLEKKTFKGRKDTKLFIQVFGLGPSEALLIVFVGLVLFGPDKLKMQFRKDTSEEPPAITNSTIAERVKMIREAEEFAKKRRTERALERIQKEMDSNNEEVIQRMEEFEMMNDR
jgi:Sec-independent protein translocase protein TatA